MRRRHKIKNRTSRKIFRKTAGKSHKKNFRLSPMRGGIRL